VAFFEILLFVVTLILSELLKKPPRIENARPSDLGDFGFPTATEGRVVPIFFGTCLLSGPNVVWSGDLRPQAITEKIKTGLFSSKRIITGYRYRLGLQMVFARGTATSLLRILVAEEELWAGSVTADGAIDINLPEFFGGESQGQGGIVGTVRVRLGSLSQTVPSYLSQFQTVGGQTPAYRGNFYLLLEGMMLGTSTSIKPWAVEARRIPNPLSLSSGVAAINSGNDCNPMSVIYEILTNTEWGLGLPTADIDTASFSAAATTLANEGNGMSLMIDAATEAVQLLNEIQRQIDGVVYLNRSTGRWVCKLARFDYVLADVPLADPGNVIDVSDYSRGSWQETTNIVLVQFAARVRDYQVTYAQAQDMANIRNQGGQIVKSELRFPGVKSSALASAIAWRELRTTSYPLARVKLVVNREFSSVNPGDVIAWTDPNLGLTSMPLRVTRAAFGELESGRIVLDLVQDVFTAVVPSFAAPGAGDWTPPSNEIVDIVAADRIMFEAPAAFVQRDPASPGVGDRVWAGFRSQNDGAVTVSLRNNSTQVVLGGVGGFLLAGELATSLPGAYALSATIQINADPDSKGEILATLQAATAADIGLGLSNLCLVGSEFIAFTGFASAAGNAINLTGCVRGLLDSVPSATSVAADTRVWFIHLAGGLTDSSFPGDTSVNIRPIGESTLGELAFASGTGTSVALDRRALRPYPPVDPRSGAVSLYNATRSLDTAAAVAGGGNNALGTPLAFTRRDFRQGDERAKVASEAALPPDFPAANTTEYQLEVRNDPQGTNTLLYQTAWSATAIGVSRNRVLAATDGVVPARLRGLVLARHTINAVTLNASVPLVFDWDSTSALSSLANLGALSNNEVSPVFVAPTTGTYDLSIGDALPAGAVEVRINGGGWASVISGAATTGTFSATAADDLEFRRTGSPSAGEFRFLNINAPSSAADAYAILVL